MSPAKDKGKEKESPVPENVPVKTAETQGSANKNITLDVDTLLEDLSETIIPTTTNPDPRRNSSASDKVADRGSDAYT